MRRKINVLTLYAVLFALTVPAEAEQAKKIPRIGFLVSGTASGYTSRIDAFRKGLRDLGYIKGKNILIEYRYSQGRPYLLPELVAELVRLNVSTIVATTGDAARVAKAATKTIPIVFATVAVDPVEDGLVSSLARPGGNVTGLTILAPELNGKRLELLKEAFPNVTRITVVERVRSPNDQRIKAAEIVAKGLGLRFQFFPVEGADDLESAFAAAKSAGAQALFAPPGLFLIRRQAQIIDLTVKNQLPAIYPSADYAEAGGLMSYGPDVSDNFRRVAWYVDKILKGTKPADLPVEQPMKFELVINLKAAKQIGVTIPPNVLARADKVIR